MHRNDLVLLNRLTDAEINNLRTAIRQGDLDETPFTWGYVLDSWRQMPAQVQTAMSPNGDAGAVAAALQRVLAVEGTDADVEECYRRAGLL